MPTTIFTYALGTDDTGNDGFCTRQVCVITGGAQGQIRATFKAASAATFKTDHCSIGISATEPGTTAVPTELLFSGAHGFTISNGATITSDWVNFSGFTSSDKLT